MAAFTPCTRESWRSPWAMYAALRDDDPVHHVADGDYWVLSRFRDVFDAARDTTTFSSAQGLTFEYGEMEKAGLAEARPMVMLDPPEHTAFRRLVGKGFTPRHVQEIEPAVRAFVVDRIERLRELGRGDIVADLFKPMPSFVVAYYLGVPEADWPRFDGWTEGIVAANAEGDPLRAMDTVGELFGYFAELIEAKRLDPGDDTISVLVHTGGDAVDLMPILGFAFTMVTGGNDTTTGLLSTGAELLTRFPDQRQRLVDEPELLPGAVEELLRLSAPVQGLARTTTAPVELHGVAIPEGRKVLLLYGSANRDPREFGPTAAELDVARAITTILTFSYGAHHCLGAAAARLQARVALEELLARCPHFAVDHEAGTFAPGHFVRRYETLPFVADAR
ncbi:MAG: cytochrome P450 [Actinomycetota bacterium]|nr:cytochrome P450 [Actinomycetota bacterium]